MHAKFNKFFLKIKILKIIKNWTNAFEKLLKNELS